MSVLNLSINIIMYGLLLFAAFYRPTARSSVLLSDRKPTELDGKEYSGGSQRRGKLDEEKSSDLTTQMRVLVSLILLGAGLYVLLDLCPGGQPNVCSTGSLDQHAAGWIGAVTGFWLGRVGS